MAPRTAFLARPGTDRDLYRRTRTFALAASASTLVAAWLAYSWTQAHRDGLLFGTRDVATALTGAAVLFAAAAVLGGAARVVRTRELSPWP